MKKEALNPRIHEKLHRAAELLLSRERDPNILVVDAFVWMEEITENEDLNQVSDIYIFEEGFGDTDKDLKHTMLHAITSVIAADYKPENIAYLEHLILADGDWKGDIAMDFFLKIGRYHDKFEDHVLAFTEQHLDELSKGQLNIAAFYLSTIYEKSKRVSGLLQAVMELHSSKYPAAANTSRQVGETAAEPITNKQKPWWKFW